MKNFLTALFLILLSHPLHALTVTDRMSGNVNYIWGYTEPCWNTCSADNPFVSTSTQYDNDMSPSHFWTPAYSADLGRLEKVSFAISYSFVSGLDDFIRIETTPTFYLWDRSSSAHAWIDGPRTVFSGSQGSSTSLATYWELGATSVAQFQAIMSDPAAPMMELYGRSEGYAESSSGENYYHGHLAYDLTVTYQIAAVPLPASLPILALVLAGVAGLRLRRRL